MTPGSKSLRCRIVWVGITVAYLFGCGGTSETLEEATDQTKEIVAESTPETVLKRIGKKAPKKIMNAADFIPMPNQKIAMGIQARGGIGRMISTRGLRSSLSTFDHPITIPSGTAITIAIEKP